MSMFGLLDVESLFVVGNFIMYIFGIVFVFGFVLCMIFDYLIKWEYE